MSDEESFEARCPICEHTLRDHHTCETSDAEQRFLDLQRRPREFGKWASEVRKRWMESPAGLLAVRRMKEGAR